MRIILSGLIVCLLLGSCTPTIRTFDKVRVDTIKFVPPVIQDSLRAKEIVYDNDTIIVAMKVAEKDTLIDVRYYPKTKYVSVKVKPDTITIIKVDTITTTQIIDKESEKSNWYLFIAIAAIIVWVFYSYWKEK